MNILQAVGVGPVNLKNERRFGAKSINGDLMLDIREYGHHHGRAFSQV